MKQPTSIAALLLLLIAQAAFAANAPKAPAAGSIEGEVKDGEGNPVIKYAGLVPQKTSKNQLFGLFLGLHGTKGDEHQQIGRIQKALASNGLEGQYMILGLKSKNESWDDKDGEAVMKAIAWAEKEYPIDPRRIFMCGFSSGGFFTGKFAPRHPELITGGIVQCGSVNPPKQAEDAAPPLVVMYILHGDKDPMVDVKSARDSAERLTAGNYRFVYRELTGDDHGLNGPGGNPSRHDAIKYFNALRNQTIPLSEAEKKIVDDMSSKFSVGKVNPPAAMYLPFLNLAGPETDAAIVLGLKAPKPEVRLNTCYLCDQRIYGKPVFDALPTLLKDKDAKVRSAAIRALGLAANFQRKDAVDALATFVKDTTNVEKDRIDAAGQLGVTIPLQLFCNNHDASVFNALTDLLDDKSSQLKELARASLDGKLTFDGQRYQISKE